MFIISLLLSVYSTIYRVKIMNLNDNKYLQRRSKDIGLIKDKKAQKTDFFIDLANTKGNIKEATIFEHVKHKHPRYVTYEKGKKRLAFDDSPSKFKFQHVNNAFLIRPGNFEDCLYVDDDKFLVGECNGSSNKQLFKIQVLKKMKVYSKNMKNNTKMEIDIEGKTTKDKDRNLHRDDIFINYSDDGTCSSEHDLSESFNDDANFDYVASKIPANGDYKVTTEIKKNIQEDPALLYKENVSNILYSTLYTTMIINSTKTVFTTVYQTVTSSILDTNPRSVILEGQDQPDLARRIQRDGNVNYSPIRNNLKYFNNEKEYANRANNYASKNRNYLNNQNDYIKDDNNYNNSNLRYKNKESDYPYEDRKYKDKIYNFDKDYDIQDRFDKEDDLHKIREKNRPSLNRQGYLPSDDSELNPIAPFSSQYQQKAHSFEKDLQHEPTNKGFIGNKLNDEYEDYCKDNNSLECEKYQAALNTRKSLQFDDDELLNFFNQPVITESLKEREEHPVNKKKQSKWKRFKESTKRKFKKYFDDEKEKEKEKDLSRNNQQNEGLLHYVGFNDSLNNDLINSNDETLYSGIRIDI